MTEQPCQRWHERRPRYRPPGEVIDPSRYGVEVIPESDARPFVERHHYAGSYPAARLAVGLMRARRWITPELVGVAVFSVPMQPRSIPCYAGVDAAAGVELGRLVLLDEVPGNGESWFVARAFKALRAAHPEVCAVLSYSDPVPRSTESGEIIMPGHVGVVYQALNATYHGRSSARTLCVDREGKVISARGLSKLRNGESGAAAVYDRLVRAGAPRMRQGEDAKAWVMRALAEGPFRRLNHPGNHAYTWRLDGAPRVAGIAYPRLTPSPPGAAPP